VLMVSSRDSILASFEVGSAAKQAELDKRHLAPGHTKWINGLGHPEDQILAPQQFSNERAYGFEVYLGKLERHDKPPVTD